jgi:hypothetical protein
MAEKLKNSIDNLYNSIIKYPLKIEEIFNNFYGEQRVDLQDAEFTDSVIDLVTSEKILDFTVNHKAILLIEKLRNKLELSEEDESILADILDKKELVDKLKYHFKDYKMPLLVHFPQVRVTNEYNKFVDIKDLFAKVEIDLNGGLAGRFRLNRSHYPLTHLMSGYMHSHVSYINFNDFTEFQYVCTGSGPINTTIANLNRGFDEDLWNLFCLELSKFVEVESVAGVPYHRLENIGTLHRTYGENFNMVHSITFDLAAKIMLLDFTAHFLKSNKLRFNFRNGNFSIGMSYIEYMLLVSNEFISWYNKKHKEGKYTYDNNILKSKWIIRNCIIANGKLYNDSMYNTNEYLRNEGKLVCVFKGKEYRLTISSIINANNNLSTILNPNIAMFILTKALNILNYKYGKETDSTSKETRFL